MTQLEAGRAANGCSLASTKNTASLHCTFCVNAGQIRALKISFECEHKMIRTPSFFSSSWLMVALGTAGAIATISVAAQNPLELRPQGSITSVPGQTPDLRSVSRQIIDRTNALRKEEHRRPVEPNPRLSEAAAYFANYMARTSRYGHQADGVEPASRANRYGYDHCIISENIAYQYNSAGFTPEKLALVLVEGWKESPGHRSNMLDPDAIDTGVAVARSPQSGYYYAVQMFGRPKSKSVAFAIANRSGTAVAYTLGDEHFPLPPRLTRSHERCRSAQLALLPPGGKGEAPTVQPENGDRLVVLTENGSVTVRKEQSR